MLDALAGASPGAQRLAVIHRLLKPDAGFDDFDAFVEQHLPGAARRRIGGACTRRTRRATSTWPTAATWRASTRWSSRSRRTCARAPDATFAQVVEATARSASRPMPG